MVTITKTGRMINGNQVCEIACMSSDTKPTNGIANGSLCLEMDTGKIFVFNGGGIIWIEVA